MIGVFICTCGNRLLTKAGAARLSAGIPARAVFTHESLCSKAGIGFIRAAVSRKGLTKLVVAGCRAVGADAFARSVSKQAAPGSGAYIPIFMGKNSANRAAASIRRAVAALEITPDFPVKTVPLRQEVLVIGGGTAGRETAGKIAALGYPTTIVEKASRIGGAAASDQTAGGDHGLPSGVEILTDTRVASISGGVGNFSAALAHGREVVTRGFGAIVIATGVAMRKKDGWPFVGGKIIPLSELEEHIAALPRHGLPRSLAILLDMESDETKAGAETAFRACLSLREHYRGSLTVVLRDVRVSGLGLEKLYDEARMAGVAFVTYGGKPSLRVNEAAVELCARDGVLGDEVQMGFELVAVSSYGLSAPADGELAETAGISLDALLHMQENNIHLLPDQSNRPGIFLVGSCRGEDSRENIRRDAKNAALSVHSLLSEKTMEVELSHAVVDGDKCALCLTCVRSCPFKAMGILAEEKRADCAPEACRRCGLCAGECPNKAITLPAYSEAILLARAGV